MDTTIERKVCDGCEVPLDKGLCDNKCLDKAKKRVKENCVICGEPANDGHKTSLERYLKRGNWCQKCNHIAMTNAGIKNWGID